MIYGAVKHLLFILPRIFLGQITFQLGHISSVLEMKVKHDLKVSEFKIQLTSFKSIFVWYRKNYEFPLFYYSDNHWNLPCTSPTLSSCFYLSRSLSYPCSLIFPLSPPLSVYLSVSHMLKNQDCFWIFFCMKYFLSHKIKDSLIFLWIMKNSVGYFTMS